MPFVKLDTGRQKRFQSRMEAAKLFLASHLSDGLEEHNRNGGGQI